MQKIFAFMKKEFLTETSYKFAFLLHIFGIFAWILTFYFIDRLFGSKITPYLKPYGVSYFSYVLIGIAFFTYVGEGVGSITTRIRSEQLMGTLEPLLATPTKLSTIVSSMAIWSFLWASISVLIYLILGVVLFGIDLTRTNLLSAFVILLLTVTSFSGLGLLAGSFIMVLKRGQPVTWVVNTLFELFGGVYFPIAVLPDWLRPLSHLLPVTYSIRAMQLAVYKGYSLRLLTLDIIALVIFSIILLPLGLLSFKWAVKQAKTNGSLSHY
ncbi:MAG: ABC transporter permease [bacterium]